MEKSMLEKWVDLTKEALASSDGRHVWSIMTAMRGPDVVNIRSEGSLPTYLKYDTTIVMRTAAFGYHTISHLAIFASERDMPCWDDNTFVDLMRERMKAYPDAPPHFRRHIIDCAMSCDTLRERRRERKDEMSESGGEKNGSDSNTS